MCKIFLISSFFTKTKSIQYQKEIPIFWDQKYKTLGAFFEKKINL